MVNVFKRFWLLISVSMKKNSKNLLYLMVVVVGMRGFLNVEGMVPNFLLTHSALFLLCDSYAEDPFCGSVLFLHLSVVTYFP